MIKTVITKMNEDLLYVKYRYNHINDSRFISTDSLIFLIENFIRVAKYRGKTRLEGMDIEEWRMWFMARIGKEPLFRLMYVFMKALAVEDIQFHEIMTEEPEFYCECIDKNKYIDYYYKWSCKHNPSVPTTMYGPEGVRLENCFEPRGMNGATGPSFR